MRTSVFRTMIAVVVLVAVIGIVVLAAIHYGDLARRPWLPIGIALAAAGAVASVVMVAIEAKRSEDRTARLMARGRHGGLPH